MKDVRKPFTPAQEAWNLALDIGGLCRKLDGYSKRHAVAVVRELERLHYVTIVDPDAAVEEDEALDVLDLAVYDGVRQLLCIKHKIPYLTVAEIETKWARLSNVRRVRQKHHDVERAIVSARVAAIAAARKAGPQ